MDKLREEALISVSVVCLSFSVYADLSASLCLRCQSASVSWLSSSLCLSGSLLFVCHVCLCCLSRLFVSLHFLSAPFSVSFWHLSVSIVPSVSDVCLLQSVSAVCLSLSLSVCLCLPMLFFYLCSLLVSVCLCTECRSSSLSAVCLSQSASAIALCPSVSPVCLTWSSPFFSFYCLSVSRGYWMIKEDQAFLRSYDLAPRPHPSPSLPSASCLSLSVFLCAICAIPRRWRLLIGGWVDDDPSHGLINYKETKTKCRIYWCL
jgi:hypothetical protein